MADVSRRSEPRLSVMFGRVVAAAALIVPLTARAEAPEVEPVTLLYEAETSATRATSTCPSQAEFFATVRAYTSRWSAVPEGAQAERTFRVRLSMRGDQWLGTLVIANEAGPLAERQLVGPTCAGVARAMAIMVGVAIDLRADGPNDTKADVDKRPEEPSADGRPQEAPADRPHEEPRAERPQVGGERPTAGPPRSSGPAIAFDVRIESTSAVIRGALPTVGASMKLILTTPEEPRWLRGWKPSLGLGLRQSLPKERALSGGSVDFLWLAGNFRVCPHELTIARVVDVAPCAEMNLGILRSSAEGFTRAREASITWLDLGGSVWAAVHLSKNIFLSSTVLVTAPLFRRPFVLSSGTVAASVPAVGLLGGIGIGLRL